MRKPALASLVAFCGLLFFSSQAPAQEPKLQFGNLKVLPSLTLEEVYDDNIYLGNGSNDTTEIEESDWITHIKPSLILNYVLPERGGVRLGYRGNYAFYSDDDDNDWKNHTGLLRIDYKAPSGFLFGINETYTDAEDPFSSLNQYKLGVPQTERWTNNLKTHIGYGLQDKYRFLAYYNFFKQNYDEDVDYTQDYDDNEFGLGFEMRVMPKTWGFIRYHHGERDYFTHPEGTGSTEANDADNDWDRVNLGLSWDPKGKLSGELNLGYQWKGYDNPEDPTGSVYEDKDTWIASTDVTYTATETTSLSLTLTRAVRESGSSTKEFYEDTGIGLTLRQKFMEKFTARAGVNYSDNEYNLPLDNPREDDNYKANLGVDYSIRDWLKAGVGYKYSKKDSNYEVNEYTDNQVLFSVSASY